MAGTYEPIQSVTLTTASTAITFGSGGTIPQTYTDLVLISNCSTSSNDQTIYAQMGNGSIDTGTNYSKTVLAGQGSGGLSARQSNTSIGVAVGGFYYGAGTTFPSTIQTHFMNYSNGTTNKTILSRDATQRNDGGNEAGVFVGLWRSTSTSAINQIKIYPSAGNFTVGSTFTLYGIKAA